MKITINCNSHLFVLSRVLFYMFVLVTLEQLPLEAFAQMIVRFNIAIQHCGRYSQISSEHHNLPSLYERRFHRPEMHSGLHGS